jgi:hypothetical protein
MRKIFVLIVLLGLMSVWPVRAEMIALSCTNIQGMSPLFTVYVDIERKLVSHTGKGGFSATVSERDVRWHDSALGSDWSLDRNSGLYQCDGGHCQAQKAQCTRAQRQF